MMSFWYMAYGDSLKAEIMELTNSKQRKMFLDAYEQMGRHIAEHEEDETLLFGEFFNMYCR